MTRKNLFLRCFVWTALAIFSGDLWAKDRSYSSKDGISLEFPDDWTVEVDTRGLAILALSKPSGPVDIFRENCNVMRIPLPQAIPLDLYAKEIYKSWEDTLKEFKRESLTDLTSAHHVPLKKVHFTHFMKPLRLEALSAAGVVGKNSYLVTCTATQESFDRWKPVFDNIISTVHIKDAGE